MHLGFTPIFQGADGAGLTAAGLAEQGARCEELGYDSIWLPEHHFSGPQALPAPLLQLAAVAARTERLRLGTTSYLLPLRHPIHAAAEVAVLDQLSGGRVILGVGRGFRRDLFSAFDVPIAEKRERFEAVLQQMQGAWAGDDVAGGDPGEEPVKLAPLPHQKPHPPIWVAAFGPKAVAQAGRLALPYLASPIETLDDLEDKYTRHRQASAEAGRDPAPQTPVMRTVFVSRSRAGLAAVREGLERQAHALAATATASLRRAAGAEVASWAIVGEPEEVADGIERYREHLGMTHLIARADVPGADRAEIETSLALLAALLR